MPVNDSSLALVYVGTESYSGTGEDQSEAVANCFAAYTQAHVIQEGGTVRFYIFDHEPYTSIRWTNERAAYGTKPDSTEVRVQAYLVVFVDQEGAVVKSAPYG